MSDTLFMPHLQCGERLRWTGRPAQGLLFLPYDLFLIPFSVLWCGFPLMTLANQIADGGWKGADWFLLIFIAFGSYLTVGRFVADAWLRAATHYAVTDRRALILRDGPFPMFRSLDLDRLRDVRLEHRWSGRGTIRLSPEPWWPRRRSLTPALDPSPQFLAIRDPAHVHALLTSRRR